MDFRQHKTRRSIVRIILNVVLILTCFLACFIEDLYLGVVPPREGAVIPFTIRLRNPFRFDRQKAFEKQRSSALSQYAPLFTYIPDRSAEAAAAFQALQDKITSLSPQESKSTQQLISYISGTYGFDLSAEPAGKLLRFPDLNNLVQAILTLEESVLQGKIIEDPEYIAGKTTCQILFPKPSGLVTFPAADLVTLETARGVLRKKGQYLLWQLDKDVRDAVLSLALVTLRPNLVYDLQENNQRIAAIFRQYPSTDVLYEAGRVLVPFRHELTAANSPLISAYREEVVKMEFFAKAPWIFMAILLSAFFYWLVLERIIKDEWRKDPPYHLFLSLLIIMVFLLKTILLLTPLPLVALPFGALPLMLVLLQGDKISTIWATLTAGLLVSLFSGYTLQVLLFFSFTGIAAVIISLRIQKRMHILFASLAIGGVNVFLFLSFWLDWGALLSPFSGSGTLNLAQIAGVEFRRNLLWAFIGGAASGPLALALLPLLELGCHTASTFRLSRYADLQHPLLKELLTKTPATYQHSMTVAYLAQSVGEAIGANVLLLRIGAYYHDIGKVANPRLFAENQNGKNPHDDLDPDESARIIIDHVINGEKFARRSKLPQVIRDFIIQHHGTQRVDFFYNKALKNNQGGKVQKKSFQYPGPKPQSVEAAVIMICDAVEAASRSLEAPTREAIETMVRLLLVKRIADGQFDECHLSTGCLAQIMRTLVNSLEASCHCRVVYPWQEKRKEKVKTIPQAASA